MGPKTLKHYIILKHFLKRRNQYSTIEYHSQTTLHALKISPEQPGDDNVLTTQLWANLVGTLRSSYEMILFCIGKLGGLK